jgi:hypothetical protein
MMPRCVHVTQRPNWWREITIWATFPVTAKMGPHLLGENLTQFGHMDILWENKVSIRKSTL